MTAFKTINRFSVWLGWIATSAFYAYQYILRVMPNIMGPEIMEKFHMDTKIFGQFSGFYYLGYSLSHIPIGILLDRYGPKKVMPICIFLTVLGLVPIILADHWIYPIFGRILMGVGSSSAILGLFKIIRITFPEKNFTRMLSLSVTIGLLGAIYGGGPVSYMCHNLGYETVIQIFTILGGSLACITFLVIPEIKSKHSETIVADVITVFSNTKVMLLCCFAGLMVGPLEGFADVWGSQFLNKVYGLEKTIAASLPSMIFVGMCFGAPFLSLIAEKTGFYLGSIIGSGIIMIITFVLLVAGMLDIHGITITFALVGICCSYQILAIYKASTYVPAHVTSLTTAVANMIIMIFGYAFHSFIGIAINFFGGIESSNAFTYGITLIPAALVAGVIGFSGIAVYDKLAIVKTNTPKIRSASRKL